MKKKKISKKELWRAFERGLDIMGKAKMLSDDPGETLVFIRKAMLRNPVFRFELYKEAFYEWLNKNPSLKEEWDGLSKYGLTLEVYIQFHERFKRIIEEEKSR